MESLQLQTSTMTREERCIVCRRDVPKSSMRRRLHSEATKHVVPVFHEIGSTILPAQCVSSLLQSTDATFLCRPCFRDAEKLLRLRKEVSELECQFAEHLKLSGEQRGVSEDVPTVLKTPPSKRAGLTEGEQLCAHPHPSPQGKAASQARKRPTVHAERHGGTGTPTRPHPASLSPAPPPKRLALGTPSRKFMEQTHVTGSPAVAVVVKRKRISRVDRLTSSLKRIGRSVGRKSRKSIALQCMKDGRIRMRMLKILGNYIRKELATMCSLKNESILRMTEPTALQHFSWEAFATEIEKTAPNLFAVLDGALEVQATPSQQKGRSRQVKKTAIVGLCTAILCRYRNQSMNLVQRLVSLILYKGGASKQVFRRLQKLLISLSHKRTVAYLDKLGEKHDAAVHDWKQTIMEAITSSSQEVLEHPVLNVQSSSHKEVEESAVHQEIEESTNSSSSEHGTETTIPSPQEPPYSPVFTMSSLTSTSSSENNARIHSTTKLAPRYNTYKLVGDNIDKTVKPRDMRIGSQTRSLHYFHTYALRDRINVAHLDDRPSLPSLEDVDVSIVLPTEQDQKVVKGLFGIHIARILRKHLRFFTKFGEGLERHIKHVYSHEMSQKSEAVPLGVILKSETNTEDMVSILEDLHSYVPTTSVEHSVEVPGQDEEFRVIVDDFHHTLFGGDQLTAARVRGSQRVRSNSQRGLHRLEGIVPVIEDWHAKVCLLSAVWRRLYRCNSGRDRGTLYHLRNLVNRRNVVKKPTKAVDACEEFFLMAVEAHVLSAAMTMFGMSSCETTPTNSHFFPTKSERLSPSERKQILLMATGSLVDKHVDLSFNNSDTHLPKDADHDGVVEYASEVLTLGLLLIEFNDAIREGDGNRICRCWQFLLLIFKATGRKNYSVEAFTLLAQLNFIFTPRMAAQLKWSRTVNVHGRPGRNVSCDMHMEHLNRVCKGAIGNLGPNISDKGVQRMGKCLGEIVKITQQYDSENGIPSESGKHARKSEDDDRNRILAVLNDLKVFTTIPGRKHVNFPKFQANPARKLATEDLKVWMKAQMEKLIVQ